MGEELIEMYVLFWEIKVLNLRVWWQLVFNHGRAEHREVFPVHGQVG